MKTYVKIDKKVLDKIEEITNTDYYVEDVYLTTESMISIIDDLLIELDKLKEELNDLENDLNDNYRPVSIAEQVAVSDNDFI